MPLVPGAETVGRLAAQPGSDSRRQPQHHRHADSRLCRRQAVAADEKADRPERLAIAEKGRDRRRDQYVDKGARRENLAHRLTRGQLHGGRRGGTGGLGRPQKPGFAQHEQDDQRQQQSGQADQHQRDAPAVKIVDDAADHQPQQRTDRHAEAIEGDGRRAFFGRHAVGNQRMGGGRAARLADADADAREQQLDEILREPAQGRHHGPDGQRQRDQAHAVGPVPVGIARDRNAEQRIEDREGRSRQQAELRVAEPQIALDRLGEDIDDLPVEEVEDIDDQQHPQHRPRMGGNAVRWW